MQENAITTGLGLSSARAREARQAAPKTVARKVIREQVKSRVPTKTRNIQPHRPQNNYLAHVSCAGYGESGSLVQEGARRTFVVELVSVAGLEVDRAPFLLHPPVKSHFDSPKEIGTTTVRVELFVDEPDEVMHAPSRQVRRAGGGLENHTRPWGDAPAGRVHRPVRAQLVSGDKSPLNRFRG